ncbi:MAG: substrate-binding domain-containing protein [Chloroflexota bacterium]
MFKRLTLVAFLACMVLLVVLAANNNSARAQDATPDATMAATPTAAPLCGPLSDLVVTPATPDPANASRGPIVYVPKSTDASYWLTVRKGVDTRAKELGYKSDYQGPAKASDIAGQVNLITNLITSKPAGILLSAGDTKALVAPAQAAAKAGVPLVTVDAGIEGDDAVAYIATDNVAAAGVSADTLAKLIGDKGKVGDLGLDAGSQTGIEREQGFVDAMKKNHPDVTVVPVQYTKGCDPATALNTATDILTANPDLVGFYSAGGPCALGIAQAVKAKKLEGKVKIVTFDAITESIPLFEDGTITAMVAQDPFQMGYCGATVIDAVIHGVKLPVTKVGIGVTVITMDNYKTSAVQKILNP